MVCPSHSGNALFGLSKLSVWWLRLGIQIQRINPGHPEQNGRHERMHRTLKSDATKPAAFNFLQQQERFDTFIGVYNNERPHQPLGGAYPGELYTPSPRIYEPPGDPEYPYHDRTIRVTGCGRICFGRRKINLSSVFAGQTIGLREIDDDIWQVSLLEYDLGYFDKEADRVEPGPSPFIKRSLRLVSSSTVFKVSNQTYVYRMGGMATCLGGSSTIGSTKQSLDGWGDSRKCLGFRDL